VAGEAESEHTVICSGCGRRNKMSETRNTIRKRVLERRLERAVRIGALSQIEADAIMEEVEAVDFDPVILIQIIMFVLELIRMWLESRRKESMLEVG